MRARPPCNERPPSRLCAASAGPTSHRDCAAISGSLAHGGRYSSSVMTSGADLPSPLALLWLTKSRPSSGAPPPAPAPAAAYSDGAKGTGQAFRPLETSLEDELAEAGDDAARALREKQRAMIDALDLTK